MNSLLSKVKQEEGEVSISDFKKYINKNVNIHSFDEYGRTILMFSAQNHHYQVFEYLVNNYSSLINKIDDNGSNIMHYIGNCIIDNKIMIDLIINKKYNYTKLIWKRNKNGYLPTDMARQCNNRQIMKEFDSLMHETWTEYHHISRDNHNIPSHIDIDNDDHDQDMDINHEDDDLKNNNNVIGILNNCVLNNQQNRKRKLQTIQDDDEQDIDLKRRKLNQIPPFSLNDDVNDDHIDSSSINSTHSSLFNNYSHQNNNIPDIDGLPSTFLSIAESQSHHNLDLNNILPLSPPQLIRAKAVSNNVIYDDVDQDGHNHNDNEIISNNVQLEMNEISNKFYSGKPISKQQLLFIRWYNKKIGRNQFLPMIIKHGYDNLNKFKNLTKESCLSIFGESIGFALILSIAAELTHQNDKISTYKSLNNGDVYSYNNSYIHDPFEMNKFNERFMRDLNLVPPPSMSIDDDNDDNNDNDDDDDDDIDINHNQINNGLISEHVISRNDNHLSDSYDDEVFGPHIVNNNIFDSTKIISFPWANSGSSSEEDDDL